MLRPGGIVLCTVPDLSHPVRWLEWLVDTAARLPMVRALGHRWPRLDGYLAYLRISRQRRCGGWWCAAAARAGLRHGAQRGRPGRAFIAAPVHLPAARRGAERVTGPVTVDIAGARMGGAARYAAELHRYLARTGRTDVRVIGMARHVDPAWLLRREMSAPNAARRVAANNVSFVAPGGERWTLLRNALHFLTGSEASHLDPALRASVSREAAVVRLCARRADVLVVPSTAMAERVTRILPGVRNRVVVRPHPVSADSVPRLPRDPAILCPVLFAPYKRMDERLAELLAAVRCCGDPSVRVRVTAGPADLPASLASDPRIDLVGHADQQDLREVWARSRAIYFPTGLESFGYPLAEARVSGQPVIARDTAQNREIAGLALCGYSPGDPESLARAVTLALTTDVPSDPAAFDPDAYFDWMLGFPP